MPDGKLNPSAFSQKVKAKYPEYKDVDDLTLARKMVEKYPEYANQVDFGSTELLKKKEVTSPASSTGSAPSPNISPIDQGSGISNSIPSTIGAITSITPPKIYEYKEKPENEYTIIGDQWNRRKKGTNTWQPISTPSSIEALNKRHKTSVPIPGAQAMNLAQQGMESLKGSGMGFGSAPVQPATNAQGQPITGQEFMNPESMFQGKQQPVFIPQTMIQASNMVADENIRELENQKRIELEAAQAQGATPQQIAQITGRFDQLINETGQNAKQLEQGAKKTNIEYFAQKPLQRVIIEQKDTEVDPEIARANVQSDQMQIYSNLFPEMDPITGSDQRQSEMGSFATKDLEEWRSRFGSGLNEYQYNELKQIQDQVKELREPGKKDMTPLELASELDRLKNQALKVIDEAKYVNQKYYKASVEGKTIEDVIYEDKKIKAKELFERAEGQELLGSESLEVEKQLFESQSNLRDFLNNYIDANGGAFSVNKETGELVLKGFKSKEDEEYFTKKYTQLANAVKNAKSIRFEETNDKLTELWAEKRKVESVLKSSEEVYSKEAQEYLNTINSQIKELDNSKKGILLTEPKEVLKSIAPNVTESFRKSFSGLPDNLTAKQKFDLGYSQLYDRTMQIARDNDISTDNLDVIGESLRDMVNWESLGANLTPEEKEFYENLKVLNALRPIYTNNDVGIMDNEQGFFESFINGATKAMMPTTSVGSESEREKARIQLGELSEMGMASDENLTQGAVKQLEKLGKQPDIASREFIGETIGTITPMIMELVATKKISTGAISLLSKENNIASVISAYDKVMNSNPVTKYLKEPFEEALNAQVAGKLFNEEEELNFTSFLLGGTGSKLVGSAIEKLGGKYAANYISSIFGKQSENAFVAINKIGQATSRGLSETVEEGIQELTQIYNDELRDRGFWEEVDARFGTTDDVMRFVISSFAMGAGFGFVESSNAREEYQNMNPEQKAVVDAVVEEVKSGVDKAGTAAAGVVNKTEQVEQMERAIDEIPDEASLEQAEEESPEVATEQKPLPEEAKTPEVLNTEKVEIKTDESTDKGTYLVDDRNFSEEEFLERLENPQFVEWANSDAIKVSITNPSESVSSKLDQLSKQPEVLSQESPKVETEEVKQAPIQEGQVKMDFPEEVEVTQDQFDDTEGKTDQQLIQEANNLDEGIEAPKSEETNNNLIESVKAVPEGSVPVSNKSVFDNLVQKAKDIASQKGLTGKKLIETLSNEVESLTEGKITSEDISDVQSEILAQIPPKVKAKGESVKTVTKENFDRVAKAIRDKKFTSNMADAMSQLKSSPLGLATAAIDGAMEVVATSIEATGSVAQAIENGLEHIRQTEWYKGLSENGQKNSEKIFKNNVRGQIDNSVKETSPKTEKVQGKQKESSKTESKETTAEEKPAPENKEKETIEQKEPEERISKGSKRASFNSEDPEVKAMLSKIGKYEGMKQNEFSDLVDDFIKKSGSNLEAIENAYALTTEEGRQVKLAVLAEAGAAGLKETTDVIDNPKSTPQEIEDAKLERDLFMRAINDASQAQTRNAQILAYLNKAYKKYPSIYLVEQINKMDSVVNQNLDEYDFVDEDGKPQSRSEAMQELQNNIQDEATKLAKEEAGKIIDDLMDENKSLKEEVDRLKKERGSKREQKIKAIQTERQKLIEQLKKTKGQGFAYASILPLSPEQIEIITKIIGTYISEGGLKTASITSKAYNVAYEALGPIIKRGHVKNISESIDEYNAQAQQERIDRSAKKPEPELRKRAEELTGKSLKEIIEGHYSGRKGYARTLAQTIANETGLSEEDSRMLAEDIEVKLNDAIEAMVNKEMEKFLLKEKEPSMEFLQKARRERGLTDEEQAILDKKIKRRKNQSASERIAKSIKMGALNTEAMKFAFEKKFGYRVIPESMKVKILTIVDRLDKLERRAVKELLDSDGNKVEIPVQAKEEMAKLQKEMNTMLESVKPWTFTRAMQFIQQIRFISILSGPLTNVRAFIGGYGSAAWNTFGYTVRNAAYIKSIGRALRDTTKATKAAFSRGALGRKEGFDSFGNIAEKEGFSSDKKSRAEQILFSEKPLDLIRSGRLGKGSVMMATQLLKGIHNLGALDGFMSTMYGAYQGNIEFQKEMYKKMKAESKSNGVEFAQSDFDAKIAKWQEDKKLFDKAFDEIAEEEFSDIEKSIQDQVQSEVNNGTIPASKYESEIDKRLRSYIGGVRRVNSPKSQFKARRIQELREQQLGDAFKRAVAMAQDASMVGITDGIGGVIAKKVAPALSINEEDNPALAVGKLLGSSIFPFVKLMANSYGKTASYVPGFGMLHAWLGVGYNPVTGEFDYNPVKGKWRSNPELVKQRMFNNAVITGLSYMLFQSMFEWDDDEERYVLDPNRPIDIHGFGFGGPRGESKSKNWYEDFQKLQFAFRDKDGRFTKYYGAKYIPELAAIVASVAPFVDDAKGMMTESELDAYKHHSPSTLSRLGDISLANLEAFFEGSFNSIGRIKKDIMSEESTGAGVMKAFKNLGLNAVKPVYSPAMANSISKVITSGYGVKRPVTATDELIAGTWMDFMMSENKTDVFGNVYKVDDDAEKFISGFKQRMSEDPELKKTAGLLYKFDRGVNIYRRDFDEMKMDRVFNVDGYRFIVLMDGLDLEAQKVQQDLFKQYVIDNYDYLNSFETVEELEESLSYYQKLSTSESKAQLLDKYYGKGKIEEVVE